VLGGSFLYPHFAPKQEEKGKKWHILFCHIWQFQQLQVYSGVNTEFFFKKINLSGVNIRTFF
jgi:hypothetical protein